MTESKLPNQEVIGDQLIEDINQLECFALGAGAGTCQVCGEKIPEGNPIAVYAFRPAGASRWRVGHSKCDDDRPHVTENFTLGVRELLVDGRVGLVTDQATQSHWRVLLAPRVRAVIPAGTTDVFDVRGLPPHVRMSRLARESEAMPTRQEDSPTPDPQSERAACDLAGSTSESAQLTFQDLAADAMEEDAR